MRVLTALLLGAAFVGSFAAAGAQAQMSPGPVVGPAVTSDAARQSGAADSMVKKDMDAAKDKMADEQKDKDKKAEDHKDKPKSN